jgi:hypothetical protein
MTCSDDFSSGTGCLDAWMPIVLFQVRRRDLCGHPPPRPNEQHNPPRGRGNHDRHHSPEELRPIVDRIERLEQQTSLTGG